MIKRLLGICVLAASLPSACAANEAPARVAEAPTITGTWVNTRGSAVTFTQVAPTLGGFYQTNLGAPETSTKFPLTGFVQGDQLTFTVNFQGYGSLTSWTGQISEDDQGPYLRTLWHLTRDVPDEDEPDDLWQSIMAGASTFRPVEENPLGKSQKNSTH